MSGDRVDLDRRARFSPEDVRDALARHVPVDFPALPGRTNHLRAAVLVPVSWAPEPTLVMIERAPEMRHHAGEIAFPGGRPEPEDPTLEATALREAREELSITDARVLGALSTVPLYTSDYRLAPFVAHVSDSPLHPDPAEVARVLHVSLQPLLESPYVEALPWMHDGREVLSPIFDLGGSRPCYGGTAHVLYELLEVLAPLAGRPAPPLRALGRTWQDVLEGVTG